MRPAATSSARDLALAFALCAATGCTGADGPTAVAGRFVDAHYVRIDLQAARELCTGLALAKIDRELALTSEVSIEADTLKPRVNYRLETARETDDSAQLVYVLTIRAPGLDPFERLATLTVRRVDGAWRVTNYAEGDPASAP